MQEVNKDFIEKLRELALRAGFKGHGKTNLLRTRNDLVQLINFQKSQWSEEYYVNFAVWPILLGEPTKISENLFPLRGRIEDVLSLYPEVGGDQSIFFAAIDQAFSSVSSLRQLHSTGRLARFYVAKKIRELLDEGR